MPSRLQVFTCYCESCKETGSLSPDGEPLGVVFPISQRIPHLARVKAERNAHRESLPAQPNSSTTAEIMTVALVDSMVDETVSSKSRLWMSRDEYQDNNVSGMANTISGNVVDEMAEAFSRLAMEPLIDDLTDSMEKVSLSPPPGVNSASPNHTRSSITRSSTSTRREAKRERNTYTKKAHLILDHVEHGAVSCLEALARVGSSAELVHVEKEIALLRRSFDSVTRRVPSVDARKETLRQLLSQVDLKLQELETVYPALTVGPVVYDTTHHFELPVNSQSPVVQLTMFIAVVCTVIMGLSRQMGNLVLNLVNLTLRWAFQDLKGNLTACQSSILKQIPTTVESVLSKFNLEGKTTIFATCPECHCTYSPSFRPGSNTPSYPATCSNRPYPDAEICSARLLEEMIADDGTKSPRPFKPFVVYNFHDYLASLLAQKDLEDVMDKSCDELVASIKKAEPAPDYVSDVFQGEFIRTFEGPTPGRLFVDRPGKEGRYLFAFNVDFFNSEGMTIRGASTSSGIIAAACLNLPLEIRYKPENMYLAGVIPGPKEPRLTELNHYMRPVVDQLSDSWERGVRFTRTANHPNGRDSRSAIANAVCDLPGARKLNQSANHSSHSFCSCCNCFHRSTYGRTDYERWCLQDRSLLRKNAEAWKNASTRKDQDDLFAAHGIRWSELWRLPYWDPPRMLVVDSMHCLLEGLVKFHFREVLKLTNADAESKPKIVNAFEYTFPAPTSTPRVTFARMSEVEMKQISQIQNLLVAPLADNSAETHTSLVKALERRNKNPLVYVAESLGLSPDHQFGRQPSSFTKLHWARSLAAWRFTFPLSSPNKPLPPISTPEVMTRIRLVIRDMATPSWLGSVPHNFGDAAAGTLKADEWRTMATVYLPVALVSLWGKGTVHASQSAAARLKQILDHTLDLVSAVSLACMRTMTESRMHAYRCYLVSWVSGLKVHHPDANHRVNNHMAFHIYDFLRLFGPVRSWWCFPFERLIGRLQRLPHNHKHGQLESTMMLSYLKAGRLKQWLGRPDSPAFLRECKALFDKAFGERSDNLPAASAFGPVPDHLKAVVHGRQIALRATHIVNGVVYSRTSTHIGNSLVVFYPGGNPSSCPVPGSIQHIILYPNHDVVFVVQRQVSAPPSQLDPFADYPHFPARIYSNSLSPKLEIVRPDWVVSHYARWAFDKDLTVVLILSRD